MSELGQSRHFDRSPVTSGLPLRTDIGGIGRHVSKVPTTDIGVSIAGKPLLFTFTSGFAFPFL
jgi:hypothetical protein